jgi:hypothetical protein
MKGPNLVCMDDGGAFPNRTCQFSAVSFHQALVMDYMVQFVEHQKVAKQH